MQLREYLQVVSQRWWVIVLTAVFAATAAFVFAKAQTPIFRSSVKLEVTGRVDYGQILAIGQLLRQLAARVETSAVANEVDRRLRLDLGPDALLEKLHTQAFPDTIQIQIDVDDVDPTRAELIAAALAAVVKERQDALMASVPQQERINLGVVDRPTSPRLFWPQTRVMVLAAGLVGLLFGIVLSFVLDYLDDSIRSAEEVERYLGMPTLGLVPAFAGAGGRHPAPGLRSPLRGRAGSTNLRSGEGSPTNTGPDATNGKAPDAQPATLGRDVP